MAAAALYSGPGVLPRRRNDSPEMLLRLLEPDVAEDMAVFGRLTLLARDMREAARPP